jgi:hypothetical protein
MLEIKYAPDELLKPLDLEEKELPRLNQEEDPDEKPELTKPFKQFAKVIYWKGGDSIEVWVGTITRGIYIHPDLKLRFIQPLLGSVIYSFGTPVQVIGYHSDNSMSASFTIGIEPVKEEKGYQTNLVTTVGLT